MIRSETSIPGTNQLFETKTLADTLRQDHHLIILANNIDWSSLTEKISKFYNEKKGRACLSLRLMIGLLLLKYIFNLSDVDVVANWEENIYYQAFTGQGVFTQKKPCDPSQLTQFRKRIKEEGCKLILAESVRIHGNKALEDICLIDSTVQEKNITYPTDSKLILKAILVIKMIASFLMLNIGRSYRKEIKSLKDQINFGKDSLEPKKKEKAIERLRTIGNSLLDNLKNKLPAKLKKMFRIASLLMVLNKAINQEKNDKHKIYSIHEPQVQCIAKGKKNKKFEFGSKVSLVVSKNKGIILGALNFSDNIYDGNTLKPAIEQLSKLHNGYKPEALIGDRGYRGKEVVNGVKIITPYDNKKGLIPTLRQKIKGQLKKRAGIEAYIGHLKSDHRLCRNLLKGTEGDKMNPLLSAAAFNLLKFAKVEYEHLHRPPKTLAVRLKPRRKKLNGLPIWREDNPLF
jgi:IS5 family transposase